MRLTPFVRRVAGCGWGVAVALALLLAACAPDRGGERAPEVREPRSEDAADTEGARQADCPAADPSAEPWPGGMPTYNTGIGGWRLEHPLGGLETSSDGSCIYVGLGAGIGVVTLDEAGLAHGVTSVSLPGLAAAEGERVLRLQRVGTMLYAVTGNVDPWSAEPDEMHLRQLDLADPARPRPTGRILDGLPEGYVGTLRADDRWLYLGLDSEIVLLDVRDPQRPAIGGRIAGDVAEPHGIAPSGVPGVFYSKRQASADVAVVLRVDARDPEAVAVEEVYEAPREVGGLVWREGYLYSAVCQERHAFIILDVRDPSAPVPVELAAADQPTFLGCSGLRLAVVGRRLLLFASVAGADHDVLQAFDLTEPRRPREVAQAKVQGDVPPSWRASAERVLWYEWQRGLRVTRFGDGPRWPTEAALVVPEPLRSIDVERMGTTDGDPLRWVGVGRSGLWTWREEGSAAEAGALVTWRRLRLVDPEGREPPDGGQGLDPHPPRGSTWRTVLHEDHAYVAAAERGLRVIALGAAEDDLARPVARDSIPPIEATTDLALREGLLFAADRGGLQVLDVERPDRPRVLWQEVDPLVGGEHVRLIGPWAVVLGGDVRSDGRREAHITVFDIADPRRPRRVHQEPLTADPVGAVNWGGRLVVGLDPTPTLRTYAIAADGALHTLHQAVPAIGPAHGAWRDWSPLWGLDRMPGGLLLLYARDGVYTIESPMAEDSARLLPGTAPAAAGMWARATWLRPTEQVALLGALRTAVLRPSGWAMGGRGASTGW